MYSPQEEVKFEAKLLGFKLGNFQPTRIPMNFCQCNQKQRLKQNFCYARMSSVPLEFSSQNNQQQTASNFKTHKRRTSIKNFAMLTSRLKYTSVGIFRNLFKIRKVQKGYRTKLCGRFPRYV